MRATLHNHTIFITGTDTGIGKSLVAAILLCGLKGKYWKPVQSGLMDGTDTQWIQEVSKLSADHFLQETYRLKEPISPHASAKLDGIRIELDAFRCPPVGESDTLIIEGAGGIMVPLNDRHLMLDLIKKLNVPVLLVASSQLGTINHTLLSLEQLRRHKVPIMGVVMNGPKNESNRNAIEQYGQVKVWAEIEPLSVVDPVVLKQIFERWFSPYFPK
jgi:dethiobiotin synthase